jgi:ketosteroid isomerase-like protein
MTQASRMKAAAVARVEVHRDGKHIFTDYLSLYRFADGWKIVGKIFQSHS